MVRTKYKKIDLGPLRKAFTVIGVLMLLSFLVGCVSEESDVGKGNTVTDDLGRTVLVPQNPQRIVSLAPSVTEILFALGLEYQIVGVDANSNYPEAVRDIEKVGDWIPDEERIVALKPDLILVSDMTSVEVISSMESKGLSVVCLAPENVYGVLQNITLVGFITGREDSAEVVVDQLEERIEAITNVTSDPALYRPTVYLEYYPYWTFGPGSFGNDLIEMAGGRNLGADADVEYPNISAEYIVGENPEIIIFTIGHGTTTTVEEIKNRPGFNTTEAVKNDRIYAIDDDILSRPGPRIVDALEELAHMIHPEYFPQPRGEVSHYWWLPCLC